MAVALTALDSLKNCHLTNEAKVLYSHLSEQLDRIQSVGGLTAAIPLTRWAIDWCACAVPIPIGWRRNCQGAGHRNTNESLIFCLKSNVSETQRAEPLARPCSFAFTTHKRFARVRVRETRAHITKRPSGVVTKVRPKRIGEMSRRSTGRKRDRGGNLSRLRQQ
jgi:hypothetical protein